MMNEEELQGLDLAPTNSDVDLDLITIKLPLLNPTWVNESKICNICGKTLKTEKGLKRHLKIHNLKTHQRKLNDDIEIIEVTTKATKKKSKMYNCSQCPKKFKHVSNFYRHGQTHSKERIDSYRKHRKSQSQDNLLPTHKTKDKSVTCDICCKTFCNQFSLTRHMKIHMRTQIEDTGSDMVSMVPDITVLVPDITATAKVKPHSCSICKKDFARKHHLKRHMRAIHTNEKPYKCPHCGMSFKYWIYVKRHLKGDSDNPCAIMDKWKDLNSSAPNSV